MNVQLDIETYKSRFVEAQKANLFYCLFSFPSEISSSGSARDKYPYLVKSANIPAVEFEERSHEIQFITLKMPGFKTYSDWVVTFNIDGDAEILTKFYEWNNLIQDGEFNRNTFSDIVEDQQIFLLDGRGNTVVGYTLINAWPKSIGEVALDYSSNEHATVQITFSYSYFEPIKTSSITKSFKDQIIKSVVGKITGLI